MLQYSLYSISDFLRFVKALPGTFSAFAPFGSGIFCPPFGRKEVTFSKFLSFGGGNGFFGQHRLNARGRIALLRSLTREIMAHERKLTSSAGRKANFFAEKWGKVRNFRFTSTAKCAILSRGTQSNPLIPAREAGKARSEPTETELSAPDRAVRLNMRNIAPFPAASDGKGAFFWQNTADFPACFGENQQRKKEEDSDDDEHAGRHSESPADGG